MYRFLNIDQVLQSDTVYYVFLRVVLCSPSLQARLLILRWQTNEGGKRGLNEPATAP